MVKLPPSSFPYERYDGATVPIDVHMMSTEEYVKWLQTQVIIGYLEGMELEIRPRTDSYGILIDDDGYETWAHVPNDIWEQFLKEC